MKKIINYVIISILATLTVLFVGCSSNPSTYQHQYVLYNYQARSCTQDEIFTYICIECGSIEQKVGQSKLKHYYDQFDNCIFCNEYKPFELWLNDCDNASKIQVGIQEFNVLYYINGNQQVVAIAPLYFKSIKHVNNTYDFIIYEPTINSEDYDIIVDNWPIKFNKYIFKDLSPNGFVVE